MRNKLELLVLLAALPAAAGPCFGQEPASTAAPAAQQSPLMLNITKDARQSRVGLDYAIRWDFKDLLSFKPGLGSLYSGVKAVYDWDITENTRVNYYGLKTNPWRLIITKEKKKQPAEAGAPAAGGLVSSPPAYRKRVRFSVSPLVNDLTRNFEENLSEFLLRSSLQGSPGWEKAGDTGRRAFVKDVLTLDIWGAPVPGMSETKEGLEYLGRDGTTVSDVPQPFTISTRPASGVR